MTSPTKKQVQEAGKRTKRNRQKTFDLNRSTPVVKEKYFKNNKHLRMTGHKPPYEKNVHDLAASINTTNRENVATANQNPQGAIPRQNLQAPSGRQQSSHPVEAIRNMEIDDIGPEVSQMVQSSVNDLQRNIEQTIGNTISREMSSISAAMAQLAAAMQAMASATTNNVPPSVDNTSQEPQPEQIQLQQLHPSYGDYNKFRVERFGLNFNGNRNRLAVEDFILRLEHLQLKYAIPWPEILKEFHLLVSETALDWYWLQVGGNNVHDWPALKHALLLQYRNPQSSFEMMRELIERRQQQGESLDSYFLAINKLRARLNQPIPEYDFIKIAKKNLRENIGKIVFSMNVSSVEQLRMACFEAESNFPKRDSRSIPEPSRIQRQINEIYAEPENPFKGNLPQENPDVAAINGLICWNCRKPGHMFMDCESEQRNIFCYRCGKPDVISPRCDCRQGNLRKNGGKPGNRRSREKPEE